LKSITGIRRHRVAASVLVGIALAAGAEIAAREVDGLVTAVDRELGPAPRSDGRFRNWTPRSREAGVSVTFPFFLRRMSARFRDPVGLPARVSPDRDRIQELSADGGAQVTWVGHATLLVQMSGVAFLTDPIWSDSAGPGGVGAMRYDEPGLTFEDLPAIDFVVVSHNHYDHLDRSSLVRIADEHPQAIFFVPLENGDLLRGDDIVNVVELDWGERREVGPVTVHCLPSQHWSQRGIGDQQRALWSSWAVTSADRRFYFGGDTGLFDGFGLIGSLLGPFDLAAVPIGAYEPQAMMKFSHLDPEQAVEAALSLRARRMLGIHFGTFDLSDEPIDEPPRRFQAAAQALGVPETNTWILDLGETRAF
jgi:N-acyl-phosphatidylethanolamine-hydrolysing phospholipase D